MIRKRIVSIVVLTLFLLASAGLVYAAQWANPQLLFSAKDLKANADKPDWVIIDCRDLKDYAKGHIAGAISFGKPCRKALRDTTSRVFTDISTYEKLLGKVGIGNNTHVVVYGEHVKTDTLKDAHTTFWILEYLGHDKVHFLNGGIDDWINAGYPLTNKPTIKPETTFKAKVNKNAIATTDEIYEIATGKAKGVQMIDARSSKEHRGEDIRSIRGGRVPNTTINVSHKDTYDERKDAKTGKMTDSGFLSPDRVAGFYKDLDKNKRTIGYCQTGTRSTLTYLELRLLGFKDPANWDDSWRVWGAHYKDYPVEDEQWFDFDKVNKLEKTVKKLEEKLEKAEDKKD